MFGLVKASRLRDAEADLRVARESSKTERDKHNDWEKEVALHIANQRAVAESRLVAVLLLKDRFLDCSDATNAANHQVVDNERTIAMMDERFNTVAATCDAAQSLVNDLMGQLTKSKMALVAIEHEPGSANSRLSKRRSSALPAPTGCAGGSTMTTAKHLGKGPPVTPPWKKQPPRSAALPTLSALTTARPKTTA